MDHSLVVLPLAAFVFAPLIALQHELGHAIVALLMTRHRVTLHIGSKPARWRWHVGRLYITFSRNPLTFTTGWTAWETRHLSKRRKVAILLGGPFASYILLLVAMTLAWRFPDSTFGRMAGLLAFLTLFMFTFAVIPMTYPRWFGAYGGNHNDGKQILNVLRGEA